MCAYWSEAIEVHNKFLIKRVELVNHKTSLSMTDGQNVLSLLRVCVK